MNIDRCTRIAELLLIENEVNKIEANTNIIIKDSVLSSFDYYKSIGLELSPIEKIMFSILTRVVDNFCRSYGLDMEFLCQKNIGDYRVDFLVLTNFSNDKVVIECDGHDFHEKTKEQAKHDKRKDRYLTALGYKILRYTGSELYNNFDSIEKELSRLLDVPGEKSLFSKEGY